MSYFGCLCCLLMAIPTLHGQNETEFCEHGRLIHFDVCIPETYSKIDLPAKNVKVDTGFEIIDFPHIDDLKLTITITLYLSMEWNEPRLLFRENSSLVQDNIDVTVHVRAIEHLWKPDIFIPDLVDYKELKVIDPLSGLTVRSDKHIDYYVTATLTISCKMNYEMYPMDNQKCTLFVQSSNYEIDNIEFTSFHSFDPESNRLQDYYISIHDISEEEKHYAETERDVVSVFSQVGVEIHMRRFTAPFIFSYYAPLMGMVFISWSAFFVPPQAIPGRVGLLVTVFLVLSTFFGTIQATTPKSEGLTALSVYALTCLLFVFFAMQEFAIILYAQTTFRMKQLKSAIPGGSGKPHIAKVGQPSPFMTSSSISLHQDPTPTPSSPKGAKLMWKFEDSQVERFTKRQRLRRQAGFQTCFTAFANHEEMELFCYKTDRRAFVLFSVAFTVFNIIYVVVYGKPMHEDHDH